MAPLFCAIPASPQSIAPFIVLSNSSRLELVRPVSSNQAFDVDSFNISKYLDYSASSPTPELQEGQIFASPRDPASTAPEPITGESSSRALAVEEKRPPPKPPDFNRNIYYR